MKTILDWFPTMLSGNRNTVLEIGAHVGESTNDIWNAAGGPRSRYFAFEPDPRNASRFREAHWTKPITFIQAAVSDRNGSTLYHGSSTGYTGSGSIKEPKGHLKRWPEVAFPPELWTKVPTITLNEIVRTYALTRIDFIWCDVQGSEDLVIAGGKKAFQITKWFYTEYYQDEIFQGQIPLEEIHRRLPGKWELSQRWEFDVLFRNLEVS